MARHFQHVAHHGAGGRARARALAEEHRLAHGVACDVDGVVHAVNGGQLVRQRQHRGMHAHVHALVGAVRQRQQLHAVAHVARCVQVHRGDVADAFGVHVVDGNARVERDGREDGDFRGGVEPVHVGGGVGLREALLLCLLERGVVAEPVLHHTREHVVRRAVHDTHDRADLVGDERVLHRVDDGDAAAHAGFERDLLAGLVGRAHDLFAVRCHERLVGRDHVLARLESAHHDVARHGGAADQLHHDVDVRIVQDVLVILREEVLHAVRDSLLGVARAHAHELHVDAVVALEILAVVLQDVDAPAADRARAHQSQFYRHAALPFPKCLGSSGLRTFRVAWSRGPGRPSRTRWPAAAGRCSCWP